MNDAHQPPWIARLLLGATLRQAQEEARAQERARLESDAALAELKARMAELESELKVRTEIMNVTSIVSEADRKGDILSVNDKFVEVSKYGRDELIGRPHSTTRHPDMPKETFKQLWSTIGRGDTFRGVIKNRAKDGAPYYVDAVVAPIMGDNGKPMKYLGVRYDITAAEIERQNARGILNAVDSSYAYIEFDLAGQVLHANKNFLQLMGYQIDEVKGRHHRLFMDPAQAAAPAYQQFWRDLAGGQAQNDVFKRVTRSGQEVWLQAIYAPVSDEMGRVVKIVKIATDVSQARRQGADYAGQLAAIHKAQAVIEFGMDGKILSANDNFLAVTGYALGEIKGQHHAMFVDPATRASAEYRLFWERLGRGEYDAGQYMRVTKGGKEIWIQASYNPILDADGKPFKVVKYATDITQEVNATRMLQQAVAQAQAVTSAAQAGDLSQRIPMEGKSGPIETLCLGVNALVETCSVIFEDVGRIFGALASGDLSQRVSNDYAGTFGQVKEDANATSEKLAAIIEDVGRVYHHHSVQSLKLKSLEYMHLRNSNYTRKKGAKGWKNS